MKWVKRALLLFVVLAGILAAIPLFISGDMLKRPLLEKIQAATGRTLTISGKFRVTFFPIAAVEMENVTVSNPLGDSDPVPFLTLKAMNVHVAVLPLLHGGVEVKSLVLDEPHINLHVNKDGTKNWLFTRQESSKAAKKPAPAPVPVAGEPVSAVPPIALPQDLLLSNVTLKNGLVSYTDRMAGSAWGIKNLNADVSLNGIDSPFTVEGDGEWNGKTVKIKARLDTLRAFLNHQRTKVEAAVHSDLITFDADSVVEKEMVSGKTNLTVSSVKALMAWLSPGKKPLGTPAPLALSINSDTQCTWQYCNFTNATLTLDKLQAKGSIKAVKGTEKPELDINLVTNVLDINNFLAPSQHANASGGLLLDEAWADNGPWSTEPMDLSGLEAVNATAHIQTDGIVFHKITIGKSVLQAKLQHGRLGADVIDADLYSGKGNITVNLDGAAAPPALEARASLKDVQVGPLLEDALGTSRLTGAADVQITTVSKGKSQKELVSALDGNGNIKLNNGTIKGVDIAEIIRSKLTGASNDSQKITAITDMSGTFTIAQGVVSNHDLVMNTKSMHISGQGEINLPAYTINYRLTPQVVSGQGTAAKEGLGVPVNIEGSLDNPSFRPDLNAVVQDALKNPQQLKEQLKNTTGGLKGKLPQGTGKALKSLLNGL